jgi:hypothetical protein
MDLQPYDKLDDIRRLNLLKVPIPKKEHERLKILRECGCLDTPQDESYDRITRMCTRYFKVGLQSSSRYGYFWCK